MNSRQLLATGVDVNLANFHGNTALHFACFWRFSEIAIVSPLYRCATSSVLTKRLDAGQLRRQPASAKLLRELTGAIRGTTTWGAIDGRDHQRLVQPRCDTRSRVRVERRHQHRPVRPNNRAIARKLYVMNCQRKIWDMSHVDLQCR